MRFAYLIYAVLFQTAMLCAQEPLSILSKTPVGPAGDDEPSGISVTFSQPVVPLSSAPEKKACPFSVTPDIKGKCRWLGTQTALFEPEKGFADATLYTVKIKKDFASALSGAALQNDEIWTFSTKRPQRDYTSFGDSPKWIGLQPVLPVRFNMPMYASRAEKFMRFCEVTSSDCQFAASARARIADERWAKKHGDDPEHVLMVMPDRKLLPDRTYRLVFLAGLPARDGNLGSEDEAYDQFQTFRTFRPVTIPASSCEPGRFHLVFSNPVEAAEFRKNAVFTPSVSLPSDKVTMSVSDSANIYFPADALRRGQSYRLHLPSDMKDMFGNKLGRDYDFQLTNAGNCPSLKMPGNFSLVESYLPQRHQFESVNVSSTVIFTARIPDENLPAFYRSGIMSAQTPEINGMTLPAPKGLGLTSLSAGPQRISGKQDRGTVSFINLMRPLAGERGGLVYAAIRKPDGHWLKTVDNVTAIGLNVKISRENSLLWATYLRTSRPVKDAPVEVLNADGKMVWRGQTGADGIAELPPLGQLARDYRYYGVPELYFLVKERGGTAVFITSKHSLDLWRFNVSPDLSSVRSQDRFGVLFSERGVYRPGETVELKGIVRKTSPDGLAFAAGENVYLSFTDARGAEVLKTTVTLSGWSSFTYSFAVPPTAATGDWNVTASFAGEPKENSAMTHIYRPPFMGSDNMSFSRGFRVEAFKPAAYEVKAVPAQNTFMAGDKFAALISGAYLSGGAMSGAQADWKLRIEQADFMPEGYSGFSFNNPAASDEERGSGKLVASDSGELDAQGTLAVKTRLPELKTPAYAVLEAGLISPDRQRLFARSRSFVNPAKVYAGVKASDFQVQAGSDVVISAVIVDPEGHIASGVSASGRIIRKDFLSALKAGREGRLEWVSDEHTVVVDTFAFVSQLSTFTYVFTPARPGQYYAEVTPEGGFASAAQFDASGRGDAFWQRQDTDVVELTADKPSYREGDTAVIMVHSPFAQAQALVTVEREGILEHRTVTLNGGADTIQIPVTAKLAPNFFVAVTLLSGRAPTQQYDAKGEDISKPQAKFGYLNITVDSKVNTLNVAVKTDKTNYRPRGRVRVMLATTDTDAQPVPAEVTLFAVDEGVLALTGYSLPDLLPEFYPMRSLRVWSGDTRPFILGQRSFGEKGENRGGGGGMTLKLDGADLRTRFVPTAYFNASVITDANGNASAEFTLPDNLSRFRVMAVAADMRRFGSGSAEISVSKPLMLRPALPRFARVGDTFKCGVSAYNYSASSATVVIAAQTDGNSVTLSGGGSRTLELEPQQAALAQWDCTATAEGATRMRFGALAGTEKDSVEQTLPVLGAERTETVALSGVTDGKATEPVQVEDNAVPGSATFDIQLSATALSELSGGARFLFEYPYGCLEQQLSRIYPVLAGKQFLDAFALGNTSSLKKAVRDVLDGLASYQTADGGFSYWPSGERPDPYMTAYAADMMTLAIAQGYTVKYAALDAALNWLADKYLPSEKRWALPYGGAENYTARAYACYVLAANRRNVSVPFAALYAHRTELPLEAKAYLLKTAARIGSGPEVMGRLKQDILNYSRPAETTLHFEGEKMPWLHSSDVTSTALATEALITANGGFPGDERALRWLSQERKDKNRWRTTYENALALRAFTAYYKHYESAPAQFDAFVQSASSVLWSEHFKGRALASVRRAFAGSLLLGPDGKGSVTFRREGKGRLYYVMRMSYRPVLMREPVSRGFSVSRKVKPLRGNKLTAGTRAVVTLTVRTAQDRTFVLLEDLLPAGFEIANPAFRTESEEDQRELAALSSKDGDDSGDFYEPYWGEFSRAENYDDRIAVFADYLTAGEHKYSYLIQATTPGTYSAPSARAEGMYEPETYGATAGEIITVK